MRVLFVHPSPLMYSEIYLRLEQFHKELVRTQQVLNQKHLGFSALKDTFFLAAKFLAHGQTNFVKMLWKFSSVYNSKRQIADHHRPVKYEITLPSASPVKTVNRKALFIHTPEPAHGRLIAVLDGRPNSTQARQDNVSRSPVKGQCKITSCPSS
jgi:hypothetical protein